VTCGSNWKPWPRRPACELEERQCSKCGEWWEWPGEFAQPIISRECKACRNERRNRRRRALRAEAP
jgi:hypothetical protein